MFLERLRSVQDAKTEAGRPLENEDPRSKRRSPRKRRPLENEDRRLWKTEYFSLRRNLSSLVL